MTVRAPGFFGACLAAGLLAWSPSSIAQAQDLPTAEEERARRLGFYFSVSLERLGQRGNAKGLGILTDAVRPGMPVQPVGEEVGGSFDERFNLGFSLGFRLRGNAGRIEGSFLQFEEQDDLVRMAGDGKTFAATLASPSAGFFEDQGSTGSPGGPDGTVNGIEAGSLSEGSEQVDPEPGNFIEQVLDGAEDVDFDGRPGFIRFDNADEIRGEIETDHQVFDVDYARRLKRMRKFELHGRVGVRLASLAQEADLAYRQNDSFAVYIDDEGATGASEDARPAFTVTDGDGDGETSIAENEPDGDGFMNGDGDAFINDRIESVATVSEDRILASIDTKGIGLKLGLDGLYELSPKWRIRGGVAVSVLQSESDWRYLETFTSERDRYLNFIEWDFNGDGVYDNRDLDLDGSCEGVLAGCTPDANDNNAVPVGGIDILRRVGLENSVVDQPRGVNDGAYTGGSFGQIRVGDPVPESERNASVVRDVSVLKDVAGSSDDLLPMIDVHVGLEYQFSRFAHLDFGLKSRRWIDAGRFRTLANDVAAGGGGALDGDFALDGWYLTLTVVPR